MKSRNFRLIIVTGLAGSGKSTAIHALEDSGFFCIDNMPVALLVKFLELCEQGSGEFQKVALVMDGRERQFMEEYQVLLTGLRNEGWRFEILFLESDDDVLLRRFSETRRRHPMAPMGSILEGIRRERRMLRQLKQMADVVVDTSTFNVHALKKLVQEHCGHPRRKGKMAVRLMSFGYKFGLPPEADMVVDVRFLPNPYFVEELRHLTGADEAVMAWLRGRPEMEEFLGKLTDLLTFLLPRYAQEGKSYLTLAVGCTGGRHRSVFVLQELKGRLKGGDFRISLRNRDISRS